MDLKNSDQGVSTSSADQPGIRNIDVDPGFYYGEIPKDHLVLILAKGKEIDNIELAIAEYCKDVHNEYFREYALDPRRALGLKLLGSLRGQRILDYGCGLGSLGILAAKWGAHVTFVDSCLLRLQVAHDRAKQNDLGNVQFIACRSWQSLPPNLLPFDAIILNGILEWVPVTAGSTFDDVVKTQLDFLRKMQQILISDGVIFLAIENRFALRYFMGYPEDHTDIPYLSIMPRDKANKLHLRIKGTEYLTWTWSLNDYRSLLPKVNLDLADAYGMFPDYRFPRLIVRLDDKYGLRNGMLTERHQAFQEEDWFMRLFEKLERLIKSQGPRKSRPPNIEMMRLTDYIFEMGLIEHFVYSYGLLLKKKS